MAGSTRVSGSAGPEEAAPGERSIGSYIYGVAPADIDVTPEARGVGERPVKLVRHGEIAALVSDVDVTRPLGKPKDLVAHERLLDGTAAEVPVLPLRFGAVMTSPDAVVEELLKPHHDEFLAALNELEGRAEYVVKGRYVEETVLTEILEENAEAARLRDEIRGRPEEVTRNARIRLGEIINASLEAKRAADTRMLLDELASCYSEAVVREPSHEWDAVHVALLAETNQQGELEQVLDEPARRWAGRVNLRLLGPLAPYDFVTAET